MIDPSSIFDFQIEPSNCHPGCFHTTWIVPDKLVYFDGHFPGHPILPAIAVLDASVEFLRKATQNTGLQLKSNSSSKFSQPIMPKAEIEIFAHFLRENTWDMEWKLIGPTKPENRLADLRISF